ncbi:MULTISPECIES: hypothetical protein [Sporosarcina]|uniref:hypothetical protein n=1 Tax=Sporosarcina TaxID=1569 RepID=UPI000A665A2A|nr:MULTISPECIES: hypothetical protein [Sporosarcina]WJY26352.1 hypothetical protein QWT68_09675 [Sporosarcina sp. 0.2-SM1T-5]
MSRRGKRAADGYRLALELCPDVDKFGEVSDMLAQVSDTSVEVSDTSRHMSDTSRHMSDIALRRAGLSVSCAPG